MGFLKEGSETANKGCGILLRKREYIGHSRDGVQGAAAEAKIQD